MMSAIAATPGPHEALATCVSALRRIATSPFDPALDRRMLDLGERKELLSEDEHRELMALVRFAESRSVERLQAELALARLQSAFPELVAG